MPGSGVELPDLAGSTGQVGVIEPQGHGVFFRLCEENRNGFSKNLRATSSGFCPSSTQSGICLPRRVGRM
jgi:hypothetical protein